MAPSGKAATGQFGGETWLSDRAPPLGVAFISDPHGDLVALRTVASRTWRLLAPSLKSSSEATWLRAGPSRQRSLTRFEGEGGPRFEATAMICSSGLPMEPPTHCKSPRSHTVSYLNP